PARALSMRMRLAMSLSMRGAAISCGFAGHRSSTSAIDWRSRTSRASTINTSVALLGIEELRAVHCNVTQCNAGGADAREQGRAAAGTRAADGALRGADQPGPQSDHRHLHSMSDQAHGLGGVPDPVRSDACLRCGSRMRAV